MPTRFIAALALAIGFAAAQEAGAQADPGAQAAMRACVDDNAYGPAHVHDVVDDGLGDHLVWVIDADGDLWMCNAGADGSVYLNIWVDSDLLTGRGPALIGLDSLDTSSTGADRVPPSQVAVRICTELVPESARAIVTVADSLGDYLVWIDTGEDLWLCNASAGAEVFVFEQF